MDENDFIDMSESNDVEDELNPLMVTPKNPHVNVSWATIKGFMKNWII